MIGKLASLSTPICPLCGNAQHEVSRLWECPQVKSYSCWTPDGGGWEITKYSEDTDLEVEWVEEA